MSLRSLVRRRPSAALVVSFLALFVALGGAGWAALRIPPNSVGNAQLRNFSVGNAKLRPNSVGSAKIKPGAVGARQVNTSQVQLRLTGPCSTGAIQSIAPSGNVTCTPVLPNEFGTSAQATLASGQTTVVTESLPAGSPYLVLANPHALISGTTGLAQRVEVDCTLSVPPGTGASSTTESLAVELGSSGSQAGTIPLTLPVASATSAQAATVSCTDSATPSTPAPAVTVDSTLNAIQTASNN